MKIKRLLFLSIFLIMGLLFMPNSVDAAIGDEFLIDGLKYKVITETMVEIIGCESELTSIIIPTNVNNGIDNYKVSKIADRAFLNNDFAEEITIPSSIETIDGNVFINCSKLIDIKVDSENTKYSAENGVLFNKNKTELISYPEGKTETTYDIPTSVIRIGDYAFWKGKSLISVQLSNTVETIGESAFVFCEALKTINIPTSVATIGKSAFCYCKSLISIEIPTSVTTIGVGAFEECDALTSIEIPNSLTAVPDRMVYGCDLLENVKIPDTITSIGEYAFLLCKSLKNIDVPNSVNEIKGGAFAYTKIETINIPYGVKSIGAITFYECKNLKSLEIPDTVTSIGMNAFWGCTALTELKIPSSVTSIEGNAFGNCTSLTIYAHNDSIAKKIAEENNINFEVVEKVYKLILDANEGKFADGKTELEFEDVTKCDITKIEKPVKDGYTFKGWYTEKTGGVSIEIVMSSEDGIKEDTTFYAQWEKVSEGGSYPGIPEGGEQEDNNDMVNTNTDNTNTNINNTNTNTPTINNPQTGDNIVMFAVIALVSAIGVVITVKKYTE